MLNKIKRLILKIKPLDRPLLSTILTVVVAIGFPYLIQSIVLYIYLLLKSLGFSEIFENLNAEGNMSAFSVLNCDHPLIIILNISSIFASLFILFIFKRIFKNNKYTGVLVKENFFRALFYLLPFFVFLFLEFVLGCLVGNTYKFGLIVLGFVPAFNEEIAFRGIIIPNILRITYGKKSIYLAFVLSSVLFAATHITNALAGADIGQTLFQVFYAFAIGALLGATLIKTGNLGPLIIAHGLMDVIAYMTPDAQTNGATLTEAFSFNVINLIIILLCVCLIFYSCWILRPSQHKSIYVLWHRKWGSAYCVPKHLRH